MEITFKNLNTLPLWDKCTAIPVVGTIMGSGELPYHLSALVYHLFIREMHRFAKWYNPQGLNAVESEKEWQAREIKLANHLQGCGYALLTVIPVIGGIARCLLQCHFKEESRVFIAPPPIPAVVAAAHAPQLIPGAGDAIEVPPLLTPHQLEGLTPQERINAYGSAVGAYDELIQYHPHTVTAAQAAFYAAKTCDMACADRT